MNFWPFKPKQPTAPPPPDPTDVAQDRMPAGTAFTYLGRQCVVSHYVSFAEMEWTGRTAGLYFDYVDGHSIIRTGLIKPHSLDDYRKVGILK